jgi:Cft2 family RNA processing exonuclease
VNGIKFWCYVAGHVLGACMFMVEIAGVRVLYTGDFSRLEDRHLCAAEIPNLSPDVLISVQKIIIGKELIQINMINGLKNTNKFTSLIQLKLRNQPMALKSTKAVKNVNVDSPQLCMKLWPAVVDA